ncbi:MAG: flagellar hook-associated protein FlgK [Nitrosomonadales bacterium]|nr:flagellar hook-associated protein FlgK [Nitrosomonadales bacterium]
MGSSIFSIGVSALNAAQIGMATTEHNIANSNTAGFSRQQIVQTANTPLFSGAGYIGQGVSVTSTTRMYNDFLGTQVLQAQAQSSQLDTYYTEIRQIDNMLADPKAGLAPVVQGFFSGVNGVASIPDSKAARQTMIGTAQSMISGFQSLSQQMTDINTGVNSQISASVATINSNAQQIATLNGTIALAQASGNGQAANDLLDQRDQLVSQLNMEVKTTVLKQTDGSYSVFIGNGQAMVVGSQAFTLQAMNNLQNPSKMEVGYVSNGAVMQIAESSIQGGKLGGLMAFRSQTLEPAQSGLGRVAVGLATNFNAQHQLGMDSNGALGGNFFTLPTPTVTSSTANLGNAAVTATITDTAALAASDYQLIFNGGTSYTLVRAIDNVSTAITAGLPQTVDGVTINLASGAATAGDTFLIRPTANAASGIALAVTDPNKIAVASPVRANAALTNAGSGVATAVTVNATPVVVDPAHPTTDLNLQQPVTITFNTPPTTYNVSGTGVPATEVNLPYTAGAAITYNGWTMSISGTPAAGDLFTVSSNTNSTSDSSNALLLAALQTKNTLVNGTANYEGAYAQLVSQVGNKAREMLVTSQAQTVLVTNTQQQLQSVSGVNLDEEAANLMRYQRAYQAAGNAIKVANTLFDTLLSLK